MIHPPGDSLNETQLGDVMQEHLDMLGVAAKRFLETSLPAMWDDWWPKGVTGALTYQQRQQAIDQEWNSLDDLDLAALLRVVHANWDLFRRRSLLSHDARSWLNEATSIRNRWAHAAPGAKPDPQREYRDLDTLALLAASFAPGSGEATALVTARDEAMRRLAGSDSASSNDTAQPQDDWLAVGSLVRLRARPETFGPVMKVHPGVTERLVTVFMDGTPNGYYETQLEPHLEESGSTISAEELRIGLTAAELLNPATNRLYSFNSGRIEYEPYQFRPVMKLINADRPRLLIADDVGVGKTIEAGLIIKELQARQPLDTVLVVCPKPLVVEGKWRSELKRFDEDFAELDSASLRLCLDEFRREGVWPARYRKAILPYSLLDEKLLMGDADTRPPRAGLMSFLPPVKFDLVIVDEAHHVRNSETWRHRVVRHLVSNAEAAVLISATPVQTGSADLFTLLRILRPDLMLTPASFEDMREPNAYLAEAEAATRRGGPRWQADALDGLELALLTDWGKNVILPDPRAQAARDILESDDASDGARVRAVRALQNLNTFSGLINRTRRRDIGDFTTRKPETVGVEFTDAQRAVYDDLIDLCARIVSTRSPGQSTEFLLSTLKRQASSSLNGLAPFLADALEGRLSEEELSEADFEPTGSLAADLASFRAEIAEISRRAADLEEDPKLNALLSIVEEKEHMSNNKLLVFSTFRHTLAYLSPRLVAAGVRVGLVHGGLRDAERRETRSRFALDRGDPDAIDVLLSSEVGTEGLDNQFCDALVNFDLPWNPMRIEQRIGRIDRRGQKSESISIKNLVVHDTVDYAIYDRCLSRIGVFRAALGGSEEILGELTSQMRTIAEDLTLTDEERDEKLQQLTDNKLARIHEQTELEDREASLFGLAVQRVDEEGIAAASSPWLAPERLAALVSHYLATKGFGRAKKLFARDVAVLRIDKDVRAALLADCRALGLTGVVATRWVRWLESVEPTRRMTFSPELADHDDIELLNTLHPLVRAAAHGVANLPPGAQASLVASTSAVPAGRYPFAAYGWRELGIRDNFDIRVLTPSDEADRAVQSLLMDANDGTATLAEQDAETLEGRRYTAWANSKAVHDERTQVHIDAQLASLRQSNAALLAQLEDQFASATHESIRRMRESQLLSAEADFDRRVSELEAARNRSDVTPSLLCRGVLEVKAP